MTIIDIFLWAVFGVSAVIYWWVGKVYISQPKWNHPRIFWHTVRAKILMIAPQLGFLISLIGGFVYTQNGWLYLGAVLLTIIVFSSRPYNLE